MTTSEFSRSDSSPSRGYPEWSLKYREALLEVDPKKLSERVAEAETAIFGRLQQLNRNQDGRAERSSARWVCSRRRIHSFHRLIPREITAPSRDFSSFVNSL